MYYDLLQNVVLMYLRNKEKSLKTATLAPGSSLGQQSIDKCDAILNWASAQVCKTVLNTCSYI